jgi:HEAT repeat protein
MILPSPRIRLRTLIILIAVCAILFRVGQEIWGGKTGRWLATLQNDPSATRREEAATSLVRNVEDVDPDLAIPVLITVLKDPSPQVRRLVVAALHSLGEKSALAIPGLVAASKDEDFMIRRVAVEGLGVCVKTNRVKESVIAALMEALEDKWNWVRLAAAQSLIRWGAGEKGVPALVEILQGRGGGWLKWTDRRYNRVEAATTLEKIGPAAKRAIPALIEATKDKDARLPVFAACALVSIGERGAAIPVLRAASEDNNLEVSSAANRALKRIEAEAEAGKP